MTKKNNKSLKIKKIRFAPTDKVIKYHDETKDLVGFLFRYDIDAIFVSNESSLHDFLDIRNADKNIRVIVIKIKKHYGVDITKVQDKPIVDIIRFMLKKDNSCFNK